MGKILYFNVSVEIEKGDDGETLMGEEELKAAAKETLSELEDILNRKPFASGIYDSSFDLEDE